MAVDVKLGICQKSAYRISCSMRTRSNRLPSPPLLTASAFCSSSPPATLPAPRINVVLNWAAGLKR